MFPSPETRQSNQTLPGNVVVIGAEVVSRASVDDVGVTVASVDVSPPGTVVVSPGIVVGGSMEAVEIALVVCCWVVVFTVVGAEPPVVLCCGCVIDRVSDLVFVVDIATAAVLVLEAERVVVAELDTGTVTVAGRDPSAPTSMIVDGSSQGLFTVMAIKRPGVNSSTPTPNEKAPWSLVSEETIVGHKVGKARLCLPASVLAGWNLVVEPIVPLLTGTKWIGALAIGVSGGSVNWPSPLTSLKTLPERRRCKLIVVLVRVMVTV